MKFELSKPQIEKALKTLVSQGEVNATMTDFYNRLWHTQFRPEQLDESVPRLREFDEQRQAREGVTQIDIEDIESRLFESRSRLLRPDLFFNIVEDVMRDLCEGYTRSVVDGMSEEDRCLWRRRYAYQSLNRLTALNEEDKEEQERLRTRLGSRVDESDWSGPRDDTGELAAEEDEIQKREAKERAEELQEKYGRKRKIDKTQTEGGPEKRSVRS